MKKVLLIISMSVLSICCKAQSSVLSYSMNFNPKADSTSDITIEIAIQDTILTDSLYITLVDQDTQIVYSNGKTLSDWKGSDSYRDETDILYLTISAGAFSVFKTYTSYILFKKPDDEEVSYVTCK